MNFNSYEFWKEISYLVSLLIATVLSILSFRRTNVEERVKKTIEEFNSVNYEQDKIFRCLTTNSRSREIAISSIISESILRVREHSTEEIDKDELNTLKMIERISRKSMETPIVVSFVVFLITLLLYFSQNWLNNYFFVFMYGFCIFGFLWSVWLWEKNMLVMSVIGFIPLLLLLLPVFCELVVIKILGLILGYLLFTFYYYFGLLGDCREPKLTGMNYIHESLTWRTRLALLSFLFAICLLNYIVIVGNSPPICFIGNKDLLFKLAPLDIFIYFVINIAFSYFLFVKQLERNLKRIFRYLVLKEFQPKSEKGHEEYLVDLAKQKEDYLNSLQIIAASDLDGLLLRKIQVDYEDKEY